VGVKQAGPTVALLLQVVRLACSWLEGHVVAMLQPAAVSLCSLLIGPAGALPCYAR